MNTVATKDHFHTPLRISDHSESETARNLYELEKRVVESSREVFSIGSHVERALYELDVIYGEAHVEGWAGDGSRPIPAVTLDEAKRLIKALPLKVRMPEFAPSVNGDITMEWYAGPNRNITLLLEGTNTLIYSARFGRNDRDSGRKPFNDVIPKSILGLIHQVCG